MAMLFFTPWVYQPTSSYPTNLLKRLLEVTPQLFVTHNIIVLYIALIKAETHTTVYIDIGG